MAVVAFHALAGSSCGLQLCRGVLEEFPEPPVRDGIQYRHHVGHLYGDAVSGILPDQTLVPWGQRHRGRSQGEGWRYSRKTSARSCTCMSVYMQKSFYAIYFMHDIRLKRVILQAPLGLIIDNFYTILNDSIRFKTRITQWICRTMSQIRLDGHSVKATTGMLNLKNF